MTRRDKIRALKPGEYFDIPLAEQTCSFHTLRCEVSEFCSREKITRRVLKLSNGGYRIMHTTKRKWQ